MLYLEWLLWWLCKSSFSLKAPESLAERAWHQFASLAYYGDARQLRSPPWKWFSQQDQINDRPFLLQATVKHSLHLLFAKNWWSASAVDCRAADSRALGDQAVYGRAAYLRLVCPRSIMFSLPWRHACDKLSQVLSRFSVPLATESWVGPGNEATLWLLNKTWHSGVISPNSIYIVCLHKYLWKALHRTHYLPQTVSFHTRLAYCDHFTPSDLANSYQVTWNAASWLSMYLNTFSYFMMDDT